MQFLNEPAQKSLDDYRASIDRVLKKVNQCGGIVAVYQIGGLSAPGISDIDLVVIVEDDTIVQQDPLEDISDHDKYFLFIIFLELVDPNFCPCRKQVCFITTNG